MNKIISSILPFILLFIAASCSQEEEIISSGNNGNKGNKQLPVNITFPGSSVHTQTRSGDTEIGSNAENLITALYVELTFGSNHVKDTIKGDRLATLLAANLKDDMGNPVIQTSFSVDYSVWSSSTNVDVKVFANNALNPSPILSEADLWQSAPVDEVDNTKKALFMSGYFLGMDKTLGDTIKLTRQVAKLRVKVGKTVDCIPQNLEILYRDITVEILNVADRSAAFSGESIADIGYIDYTPRQARNDIPTDVDESGLIADSCYIHENKAVNLTADQITTLNIKIPTIDPLTHQKETIEREIKINDAGGNKIERNNIYTLDIKIRSQKEPLDIFLYVEPWQIQEVNESDLEPVPSTN